MEVRRDRLEEFARSALTHDDHVVVEATGNAAAVAEVLAPHVGRVVIANPKQVRLIAHAKVKTDGIDAAALARLYASGFLPEVRAPGARTQAVRRQVARREQLVRQRTRLKNIVRSILHAHLVPPCPHADLFGPSGRGWPAARAPPEDERLAVERLLPAAGGALGGPPPVGGRPGTGGSPSRGAGTPAACRSRRPGRRRARRGRSGRSSGASPPVGAGTSPRWPPP